MKITKIETNKFKTNLCAIFLTLPLSRETITYNALIPAVLRRGTANLTNQLEINKKLENMYGAGFNCGVDKIGNFCVLKFFIEVVNDKFLLEDSNITAEAVNLLKDIVFNPYLKDEKFSEEYVEQEKENLKKVIMSRKDDKSSYAVGRCIEEMFAGEPYGIYKFGYEEDFKNINAQNLYDYYKKMLENCKTDFYIAGDIENLKDAEFENIEKIENYDFETNDDEIKHKDKKEPKILSESMDVTQGKLILGLNAPTNDNKYAMILYSTVLGGGANSKLFQNVREKAGLAYSASASYIKRKDLIVIRTGIEIPNYDKALKIIKSQLQDIKDGKITDDEFKAAKQLVISSLKLVPESQEDLVSYYFDQELFKENTKIDEYISNIEKVTKNQVIEVAKNVNIDTIYFLKN